MKYLFFFLKLCILLAFITSCDDVKYEYGEYKIGIHFYDSNKDTVTYSYFPSINIKKKMSHDTCYTFDMNDSLLSVSTCAGYYLNPNFIYVIILDGNFEYDDKGYLELSIKEDNLSRKLKFSSNIKGPASIFKIHKSVSRLEIKYKEYNYKVRVNSDYAYLYLSKDKANKLTCNYTNNPILSR